MLTKRQESILTHVVELYVATAEPVGSRQLVKRFKLKVSPATIRNEMSDLEDLGFLEQPHTSAGRVPTDQGYRYYVDNLLLAKPRDKDRTVLVQLERDYMSKCGEIRTVLSSAVKILSEVTSLTGVAVSPTGQERPIRKVQLVGIDSKRVLMVVVNASSLVTNHMLEVDVGVPQNVLNRLSDIINDNFSQASVKRLLDDELVVLKEIESRYRKTVRTLLTTLEDRLVSAATEERLYLEGVTLILEQPEFRSFEKAKLILERFVDQTELSGLFKGERGIRPRVRIGEENTVPGLQDFSLITSPYKSSRGEGALGIIGPRRMEYARIMALVNWVSQRVSEILSDRDR